MDTAKARILSATGRREEARRLVSEQLGHWRSERRAARAECRYNDDLRTPVRYASLAADAGLKAEAVEALGEAMRCGDLPFGFWPQLPWFRSLEGYAPYDELVRERARRVQRIRQDLLQMEAGATGTVATIPGAPLPWPEAGR
jgi:hypothetical protein